VALETCVLAVIEKEKRMNEDELIRILQGSGDFSGVSSRSLEDLIRAGTVREPATGSEIVRQGESSQQVWILLEGEFEILIDGETANRISRPGEIVGQISAVSLVPATATVRVAAPSKCLTVSHRSLNELFNRYPDLAAAMLRSMAKYLGSK